MIYHNKHDIGAVTSLQSSCSVVYGPGGSRNVGELVRRRWSRLSEKSLVDGELWLHSHQRPASLKILELWAHPIPLDPGYTGLGCPFAPWRRSPVSARLAVWYSWTKLCVLLPALAHALLAYASFCPLSLGWVRSQVGRLKRERWVSQGLAGPRPGIEIGTKSS